MAAPNSHDYEQQLREWLITYLLTDDEAAASKASGLQHSPKRIIARRLQKTGTLAAVKPSGRPPKYDAAVCEQALLLLEEHAHDQLNLGELLGLLVAEGAVEPPTDVGRFSAHLREYVHEEGGYINTTSSTTIFFLATTDFRARLSFSSLWLPLLTDTFLDCIVFIDETTVEEATHPKGGDEGGRVPHSENGMQW